MGVDNPCGVCLSEGGHPSLLCVHAVGRHGGRDEKLVTLERGDLTAGKHSVRDRQGSPPAVPSGDRKAGLRIQRWSSSSPGCFPREARGPWLKGTELVNSSEAGREECLISLMWKQTHGVANVV